MQENFARSLAFLRRWEGGWSNHPSDPGGLTRWGITLKTLKALGMDVNGDGVIDGEDLASMTEEEAAAIYRLRYWDKTSCDLLPGGLDLAVFDSAVNQGPARAVKFLQKAVGTKPDGVIGPKTVAAIAGQPVPAVLTDFMARRAVHYSSLVIVAVFGLGWFRRMFDCHATASSMGGHGPMPPRILEGE